MYGLEGILGNLVTSVATPAIGGLAGDIITKEVVDNTMPQLLKEMTQTTVGALSGAALGAGIGALTGGKSGALSGAITGGIGGGVGGYNAQDISQMFGMGQQTPQGVEAPQARQVPAQASPMPFTSNAEQQSQDPFLAAISPKQSQAQLNAVRSTIPAGVQGPVVEDYLPPQQSPASAPTPAAPSEYKDYLDFLKKNYEPLAGGFYLGSAYGATQDTNEQAKKQQQNRLLAELLEAEEAKKFAQSVYAPGRAAGGPVNVGLANPQIQVHFPAWAQEQIQREGGLAALQPGVKQGMAQGGYINLQPMGETAYPQALVPKAHPYPAASPQRREVVQMAHGGLIDGPGDGMSDSIPANIGGREPVKVADGEYVIPQNIAEKYGPDRLQAMMTKVRAAAHAKKGKQVVQDAGKKAFIKSLTGVRA